MIVGFDFIYFMIKYQAKIISVRAWTKPLNALGAWSAIDVLFYAMRLCPLVTLQKDVNEIC